MSCVLSDGNNCGGALSTTKITAESISPWKFDGEQNDPSGYQINLCMRCSDGINNYDNVFTIKLNALTCTDLMIPKASSELIHPFDNPGPQVYNSASLFTEKTIDGCSVTCSLG